MNPPSFSRPSSGLFLSVVLRNLLSRCVLGRDCSQTSKQEVAPPQVTYLLTSPVLLLLTTELQLSGAGPDLWIFIHEPGCSFPDP